MTRPAPLSCSVIRKLLDATKIRRRSGRALGEIEDDGKFLPNMPNAFKNLHQVMRKSPNLDPSLKGTPKLMRPPLPKGGLHCEAKACYQKITLPATDCEYQPLTILSIMCLFGVVCFEEDTGFIGCCFANLWRSFWEEHPSPVLWANACALAEVCARDLLPLYR
ncbi:hypothetical protein CPB86DRAFT_791746 [Serendipita vermifera]|nr:hypothetical protein CPB86DRAFT_791746 [Serendipita vermifera]